VNVNFLRQHRTRRPTSKYKKRTCTVDTSTPTFSMSSTTSCLWSPYVIGQTIIFCPVVSFFLLSFFLALSQRSEIGCLPYFHTWCSLSANSESMSEMCCTRLAENTERKNRHFGTIGQLCRAVSS